MSRFKTLAFMIGAAVFLIALQSKATWIYNPSGSSGGGVTSLTAGAGIQLSGSTGAVTVSSTGVTSLAAGAGIILSNSTGTVTVSSTPKSTYFLIENPTATEDNAFWIANRTSTITSVTAVNKSTGDTATINLIFASSRATASSSAQKAFSSNTAVTATTTPATLTLNGSTTVSSGHVMRFITSAASSSQLLVQVNYID